MDKDTLTSTALTSDAYAAINEKILKSVKLVLRFKAEIRTDEKVLSLELSAAHHLEARVVIDGQGIPHSSIRIKTLGVPEGAQYPTWTIDQRVQGQKGNVIFASYRRPHHFGKVHLTLDEMFNPGGIPAAAGSAGSLLWHIVEVVPLAIKSVN